MSKDNSSNAGLIDTDLDRKKLCTIVGVGPGVGVSCARLFASQGYQVVMIARDRQRLQKYESEIPNAVGIVADCTSEDSLHSAISEAQERFGTINTLIYNAARGTWGPILDVKPADMQLNFAVNTLGLMYAVQAAAPAMLQRGSGNIMVTGNTSSLRGKSNTAVFAPTKAAQRILTESMAKEFAPKGIHVSYLIIDAVIDVHWARDRFPNAPDEFYAQPDDIAETIWNLCQQKKSAWTFQADIRPFCEKW